MRNFACLLIGICVLLPVWGVSRAFGLGEDELKRYGFGDDVIRAVEDSRRLEAPVSSEMSSSDVPSPVVRKADEETIPDVEIPSVPGARERVFEQSPGGRGRPREGSVEEADSTRYRGDGDWRTVEEFFFRPEHRYPAVLSLNEGGLTGLERLATPDVPRRGSTWFRAGIGYTRYEKAFGVELEDGRAIEQVHAPFTYLTVPWNDLELSLQVDVVNEKGEGFPLPTPKEYELTGVRSVSLMAKYRFFENPTERLSAAFALGMHVGVDRDATRLGSNGVDYEFILTVAKAVKNFRFTLCGGALFTNGEDSSSSSLPDIVYGGVGVDFHPLSRLTLSLEYGYWDWDYVGRSSEITWGTKYRLSSYWTLDLSIPIEISNDLAQGYHWRGFVGLQTKL